MKFCIETPKLLHYKVSLRQDADDVDILINGKAVAYLRGSSGKLELIAVSKDNQPTGVQFSSAGCITVSRP